MRVTNRMVVDNALRRINQRQTELDTSRTRLSTGRQLTRLSQDPTGASRVLGLRADERANEQFLAGAEDARALLGRTDDVLQSLSDRLRRARDLAVAGANSPDASARTAIGQELASLREEIRVAANQRHDGRPLFGGFRATDPFVADPVTGAVSFAGDDGQVERRIGDSDTVVASVAGRELFGFTGGDDVFTVLQDLEASVLAGDVDAVSASIADIDASTGRVHDALAHVGATQIRVDAAVDRIGRAATTLRGEISMVEDVDVAEAVMELQLQEMAYQATLAATSRALPPSLVDFLR